MTMDKMQGSRKSLQTSWHHMALTAADFPARPQLLSMSPVVQTNEALLPRTTARRNTTSAQLDEEHSAPSLTQGEVTGYQGGDRDTRPPEVP